MKKLLRRWLGIKDESPVPVLEQDDLYKMVGEAVEAVMSEDEGSMWDMWEPYIKERHQVQKIIKSAMATELWPTVRRFVQEIVEKEQFIDNIIKRIKDKQLHTVRRG